MVHGRAEAASRPQRGAIERAARPLVETGIFERSDEKLFTLAFEFFLGSFEVCHPFRDFFALAREPIVSFAHACPC
jgi:hypothetical protein